MRESPQVSALLRDKLDFLTAQCAAGDVWWTAHAVEPSSLPKHAGVRVAMLLGLYVPSSGVFKADSGSASSQGWS